MNFSLYFAQKIILHRPKAISKMALILAIISIALGIAVMLLAVAITFAFEDAVKKKIVGFVGDIQITRYGDYGEDSIPRIEMDKPIIQDLKRKFPQIASISSYIIREGILKSPATLEGVQVKGVAKDWSKELFQGSLTEGTIPNFHQEEPYSKEIFISLKIKNLLDVKLGDRIKLYFMEKGKVRLREVKVAGIYETGVIDFDQRVIFCDIRLLQRIMGWKANEVEGLELQTQYSSEVDTALIKQIDEELGLDYQATSTTVIYPNLFVWLDLQNQNVIFILILMTIVAVINMSTAIIIVITERRPTIGLLKAIGATNQQIQWIFVYHAGFIITIGTILGNFIGMIVLYSQDQWHWFKLDQESYFIKEVPVSWEWTYFLTINIGVIVICTLLMLIPTKIIQGIKPINSIKME